MRLEIHEARIFHAVGRDRICVRRNFRQTRTRYRYGDGEPSPDAAVRVFEEYLGWPETATSYLQSFHKFERSAISDNTGCKRIRNSRLSYDFVQEITTDKARRSIVVKYPRQSVPAFSRCRKSIAPNTYSCGVTGFGAKCRRNTESGAIYVKQSERSENRSYFQ